MSRLRELKKGKESGGIAAGFTEPIRKHLFLVIGLLLVFLVALEAYAFIRVNEANARGKVVIKYYYSEKCGACRRTTPVIEKAAGDFGTRVKLEKKCVTLIGEDNTKCIKLHGLEQYEKNMREVMALGTRGTPTTLFNERTVVGGFDEAAARNEICIALYGVWGMIDLTGSRIENCR